MTLRPDRPAVSNSLTIVVPAYNEAARIAPGLRTLCAWAAEHAPGCEIIVVDDGSRDDTRAIVAGIAAEEGRVRLESLPVNRGKGAAVRRGVELAQRAWILLCDADLSTPIGEIDKLAAAAAAGADIAIASRDLPTSDIARHQPAYREALGRAFNGAVRALVLPGLKDTQCGFKLFESAAARRVFARMTIERFAFDVEVLYIARRLGYRIAEVGVRWVDDARSTVDPWRDGMRMVQDIARIRLRHRGL